MRNENKRIKGKGVIIKSFIIIAVIMMLISVMPEEAKVNMEVKI